MTRSIALVAALAGPFAIGAAGCASVLGADFDRPGAATGSDDGGGALDAGPGVAGEDASSPPSAGSPADGTAPPSEAGNPAGDGGGVPPNGHDAGGTCGGTALTCAAFDDSSTCVPQAGCAWTPPACSGEDPDCSGLDPSACQGAGAACVLDLNSGQCSSSTSWCPSAGNAATCTSQHGCAWSGGCAGTPKACASFSVAECASQRGCSVVN